MARRGSAALAIILGIAFATPSAAQSLPSSSAERNTFGRFVEGLWPEARAAGVSRETFDEALKGIAPDPKVAGLTRRQGEFSRPISAYVGGVVSAARIAQAGALAEQWNGILNRVEATYGVPRGIVLAIWGSESGFGAATGGFDTIRSLATLAHLGSRPDYFRRELIAALRILQEDHVARAELKGSWAGAMGQTQFMPSSFLAHAADGDGDGRRDIWRSVPDVLASIGNFFAQSGWKRDVPWGFEVRLPGGLDLSVHERGLRDWAARGMSRPDRTPLPESGTGRLFLPAGIEGPAFLLTENWEVIRAYNTSDAYALGIGLLSDRISGGSGLSRPWPTHPVLSDGERREVHRRLAELGFYTGTPDGKFGAQTRDAVRRFQLSRGLLSDGYADAAVLTALRGAR